MRNLYENVLQESNFESMFYSSPCDDSITVLSET